MADWEFTSEQREAIATTGRSVIVSAAAGAGKTAVLAERCAYLVCDAPATVRCDIDGLLVLTFTEAAAAEMRSRIIEAVRSRQQRRPNDLRLGEQAALAETAQISTIHSFCLWILRRWFNQAGIDPAASVLDEHEAALIRRETLDRLFTQLYAAAREGQASPGGRNADGDDGMSFRELGPRFVHLVDDYGLGIDREIGRFVLRLYEFTCSLTDPESWLRDALSSLTERPDVLLMMLSEQLARELAWQRQHCADVASELECGPPVQQFYAAKVRAYVEQLERWAHTMDASATAAAQRAALTDIGERIAKYELSGKGGPRLSKDTEESIRAARDAAAERFKHIREKLFTDRLTKAFALFSPDDYIAGLRATAPYTRTVIDLVRAFRETYTGRKRALNVLDFADLERLAFRVLHREDSTGEPSELARHLHARFDYVLVDEFQDINPVQEAIIRLASRESDPSRADNLFVVGDVKQSIYRFRLAEPAVFAARLDAFRSKRRDGVPVFLQTNFRSRSPILEAVNHVFRRLLPPGWGDVVYDTEAELRPGRNERMAARRAGEAGEPVADDPPVEVHLLEKRWSGGSPALEAETENEDESIEPGVADWDDPSRWPPIEREAYLIGRRIRELVFDSRITTGTSTTAAVDGARPRFRDIAILLRAAKLNAERMVAMLTRMGVPAYSGAGGSLMTAREVREVLEALKVLDNPLQDIPLASTLRSGIFGEVFTDEELVTIRCHDRKQPFYEVVREYAEYGAEPALRDRLSDYLSRIERWRTDARRRPLSDVLWRLFEQHGYFAYTGGLPNGPQRRANLLRLHELARKFGSFRRQGLHRFLHFIRTLAEDDRALATAPAIGVSEDVVRVMSIHQAKGLEFPVVFVAGLGTKLNLGDRDGRMLFARTAGIGLRVVDSDRMIEYSSLAHRLVAAEIEQRTREEELRVLYVAMTRARDRLILVGSAGGVQNWATTGTPSSITANAGSMRAPRGPSHLAISMANTPLDWLLPIMVVAPRRVTSPSSNVHDAESPYAGSNDLFDIHVHDRDDMAAWRFSDESKGNDRSTLRAAARCEPLPDHEPIAPGDPEVEQALAGIDYNYPHLVTTTVPATIAASAFKGAFDFLHNPESRGASGGDPVAADNTVRMGDAGAEAARRGIATHRLLQRLDFRAVASAANLEQELQRIAAEGWFQEEEMALIDRGAIEWLLSTPLAEAIRSAGSAYRRELPYLTTESVSFVDHTIRSDEGDFVVVRGIVDGILPVADGIEIVDFKTDAVKPESVAARAERYRPQMQLYARAMSRLFCTRVSACHAVFLTPRRVHTWPAPELEEPADGTP